MGKDEREEQKRWPRVQPFSSLSGGSSFPYSIEMQWVLIFWPLHPLVQHAVATFVLCASVLSRMGGMGARICVERGLGGIIVVTLIAIEVWASLWWNDRGHVGSERGSHTLVPCAWSCLSHLQGWAPR
jgi:hypothetical protein